MASTGLTEAELAFASLDELPLHAHLPPATLRGLQTSTLVQLAASPSSGTVLLRQALYRESPSSQNNQKRYSTTLAELDELLDGGWEAGEVVEMAGGRQSGRSSLVLYSLLHHLLVHPNNRAVFIHSSPTFDALRCRSILHVLIANERSGASVDSQDGDDLSTDELAIKTLGRLAVLHPFSPSQALEGLVSEIEKEGEQSEKLGMVVVDSVETLLGGEVLLSPSPEGAYDIDLDTGSLNSFARRTCNSGLVRSPGQVARPLSRNHSFRKLLLSCDQSCLLLTFPSPTARQRCFYFFDGRRSTGHVAPATAAERQTEPRGYIHLPHRPDNLDDSSGEHLGQ